MPKTVDTEDTLDVYDADGRLLGEALPAYSLTRLGTVIVEILRTIPDGRADKMIDNFLAEEETTDD